VLSFETGCFLGDFLIDIHNLDGKLGNLAEFCGGGFLAACAGGREGGGPPLQDKSVMS
jgi:hypothetical protein